ncbi:MAG: LTA synthase family protein [Eubacteriales bacterium]|jgi:phosphoglycerol transferase MdoB-like AlkP superfamily enzyme
MFEDFEDKTELSSSETTETEDSPENVSQTDVEDVEKTEGNPETAVDSISESESDQEKEEEEASETAPKKRVAPWKTYQYSKKYKIFWSIYWGITLILTLCFSKAILGGNDAESAGITTSTGPVFLAVAIIAVFVSAFVSCFILRPSKPVGENGKLGTYQMKPYHLLLALATSIYCFWILEYVNNPDLSEMEFKYMVMNVAGIFIMMMIMTCWLNSLSRGMSAILMIWTSFAIAFYLVYTFRGEPLQFIDFYSLWTATTVVGNYSTPLTRGLAIDIVFCLDILGIFLNMRNYVIFRKGVIKKILLRVGVFVFMLAMYPFYLNVNWNGAAGIVTDLFAPYKTYKEVGTTVGFFCVAKYMRLTPPDGYSASETEEIANQAVEEERENDTTDVKPVNIICIMNEAWGDYEYGGDFTTNQEIMPFYNSLTENTIKGHTMVCIIGGGTAKTEYEFLTGNSVKRFPAMVPYVSYFTHSQYSLVSTLKSQGYEAIAFHPYKASNWNRPTAYRLLGFDDFISEEDLDTSDMTYIHSHISDMSDYQYVIDMVNNKENEDDPLFIFNVTMQNHGGYSADDVDPYITVDGLEDTNITDDELLTVERYLTLMNQTDQALEYLINYFEDYDEPTIICMFGDHYPTMPDAFYRYIAGDSLDDLPLEEKEKFYSTPFLIWANYDIPEAQDVVTSTNYLSTILLEETGLEMTHYNYYLKDLQAEIPALNHFGYLGTDGEYHYWSDADDNTLKYEWEYECLQYNELAETRKRLTWFFSLDG